MTDELVPDAPHPAVPEVPGADPSADAAGVPRAPVPSPTAEPLTGTDLARIDEITSTVDITDPQAVVSYGLPAQSRIAGFADSLLGDVRNKDAGSAGQALGALLKNVRALDVDSLGGGSKVSKIPVIGKMGKPFEKFATRYQKVATSIEKVTDQLERARMGLLKDMTVLEKMYELNLEYLKQLDLYIAAGEQILVEMETVKLPELEAEVRVSDDALAAQRLADFRQAMGRFERRLHDLKLTRQIAIQTAPQIRLIQGNDTNLVEKIQSSILNTIPLWKNQIVIAITLYRQQQALGVQKQVTDMTNELLAKNAALLKDGSAKVAREVERGVVDIETLRQVNADLIGTIEETLRIQEEARTRRVQAEGELVQMQSELKRKLLEVRSQAPLAGGGTAAGQIGGPTGAAGGTPTAAPPPLLPPDTL
jgi:uncharacterized protein YaaN involved in tellurite resistance